MLDVYTNRIADLRDDQEKLGVSEAFHHLDELPEGSLARRENWPDWANDRVGDREGLEALNALAVGRPALAFLGSPFLSELEPIRPRVSEYTGDGGSYVAEPTSKTTVCFSPGQAVMRATISRPALQIIPDVDLRCWSGHYPRKGEFQGVTTVDMVRAVRRPGPLRFVAVIDTADISATNREENMHDTEFMLDLCNIPELMPACIVPVSGDRDLPADTLIINAPISRAEAHLVFPQLEAVGDGPIPETVEVELMGCKKSFPIVPLDQLAITQ
jgi:hypothetical protein